MAKKATKKKRKRRIVREPKQRDEEPKQRDEKGRFVKGHTIKLGRRFPSKRTILQKALENEGTRERIIAKAIEQAEKGNAEARNFLWVNSYGKPRHARRTASAPVEIFERIVRIWEARQNDKHDPRDLESTPAPPLSAADWKNLADGYALHALLSGEDLETTRLVLELIRNQARLHGSTDFGDEDETYEMPQPEFL